MALFIGPGAVHHPISQKLQQDALVTPQRATRKRRRLWSGSSLDPEPPEFVSPAAVSTQDDPSRDYIRSLIAAKEAKRKIILQRFTSVKAQLDGARKKIARAVGRATLDHHTINASSYLYVKSYCRMEQEILELEVNWDNVWRDFVALDEEIEELWGELAVARW